LRDSKYLKPANVNTLETPLHPLHFRYNSATPATPLIINYLTAKSPFVRWKWLKRLVLAIFLLCVLLVAMYVFRVSLLRGAARAWIVNQPLTRADVIVVLGGGPETRPFEAARLFQQGLAPRILLMNPKPPPTVQLGLMPAEADVSRGVLLAEHVPPADIFVTTDVVTNSHDEAVALRNWASTNNLSRVIIPTDLFHTRRVRWLYAKELRGTGIQAEIEAVDTRQYTATNWWQHEDGLIAFQNEVLKYAYYRLRY
jgi:uncharacterized SAM-binding protein YcdF (DUF218 family)